MTKCFNVKNKGSLKTVIRGQVLGAGAFCQMPTSFLLTPRPWPLTPDPWHLTPHLTHYSRLISHVSNLAPFSKSSLNPSLKPRIPKKATACKAWADFEIRNTWKNAQKKDGIYFCQLLSTSGNICQLFLTIFCNHFNTIVELYVKECPICGLKSFKLIMAHYFRIKGLH